MIGIDTNVLIRYLAQDDPIQSQLATKFIEKHCTAETPGFINHITLCEMCWVLKRLYKTRNEELHRIIEQLLRTAQLAVQHPQIVWMALEAFQRSDADFPDCLISQVNLENDCASTVTLDRQASRAVGFRILA